jgi:hypothetical protein
MFCRDLILLGFAAPASQSELVRYVASVSVGFFSMVFYAVFAWAVMLPIAANRFPYPDRATGDQKRDLNDRRFFFCLWPWFVIVMAYAAWDISGGSALPFSDAVIGMALTLAAALL